MLKSLWHVAWLDLEWSDFSKYFLLIKLTHYFSFWFSLITRLGLTLYEILIEYALCFMLKLHSIPFHSILFYSFLFHSIPFHSILSIMLPPAKCHFLMDKGSIYSKKKILFCLEIRNKGDWWHLIIWFLLTF